MKNTGTAIWTGKGIDGSGTISNEKGILKNVPYSYKSRTENSPHTNPEELIAAAHAACFAMKLAFVITEAGYVPDKLETSCEINFESGAITGSILSVKASIKNISKENFEKLANEAANNCPVTNMMKTPVTLGAAILI